MGTKWKNKSGNFLGFLPPSKNNENLFSIFLKIHKHKVCIFWNKLLLTSLEFHGPYVTFMHVFIAVNVSELPWGQIKMTSCDLPWVTLILTNVLWHLLCHKIYFPGRSQRFLSDGESLGFGPLTRGVIGQEIIHVRLSVRFIAFCAQTVNTCRQVSILSIDGNSNNTTLRVKG